MEHLYSAAPLETANADYAFPLMSLRHPGLSLRDWRAVVRRLSRAPRDRAGLMMVRNARDCVLAVFAYRTSEPLVGGLMLRVTDVIMGRLPGDALPNAIAACVEELARDLGHACIAIEIADDALSAGEAGILARAGFACGGRVLVRTAPAEPARHLPDGRQVPTAGVS
ncbi:hypothetical protein [Methylobacterium nigriterrae]|uniref:hypothetical protein n=1 Tax=Methylobacterium nigriterrae TaxID=3127512 RepID=UPI003013AF46